MAATFEKPETKYSLFTAATFIVHPLKVYFSAILDIYVTAKYLILGVFLALYPVALILP